MLCTVIKGPTFEEAYHQISKAILTSDLIELRLDCFDLLNRDALKTLRSHFSIPMIFTLRSQTQGGNYPHSEEARLIAISHLAMLEPEYLDLESHIPSSLILEITSKHPKIKLILSTHDFTDTPEDLDKIFWEMKKIPAFFYKIAVMAKNSLDAMRVVCWKKKSDNSLIAISMGPYGEISRILAPIIGSPITYASLEEDQKSAPGQLSANILINQYHHRSLTPHTAIYGLMGDPAHRSISDVTHNHLIKACGLDAIYVKIEVKASELPSFLSFAKQLPFAGLSVTTPLKETVIPFLDEIDREALKIGAVNTLLFHKTVITGFNTDGIGALDAIEQKHTVTNKRIIIIGAGGAAKAIAYEALQRGGFVTIVNRDKRKATEIAKELHCVGKGLDSMEELAQTGYDILINSTPSPLPIARETILPTSLVMDINTKPKETLLLQIGKKNGCSVVYGYQMFTHQALGQFALWFNHKIEIEEGEKLLKTKASELLCEDMESYHSFLL